MNIVNLKPVTTIAAACVLSLVSAAAFAARGGAAPSGATMRGSAAQASTMRASVPTTRMTTTTTTTTAPKAVATKSTTTTKAATTTGQPGASCEATPNQPGNSISAPGSAFNPTGTAGEVYAGEQPQNSINPHSVSQYDVACARNRSH
jgi:hypothetical protein